MRLWRLAGTQHAGSFDGGYGLLFDGRWNTVGHAVTYCATSPSLCVLEKLVHVEDPALLPDLVMVSYRLPEGLAVETVRLDQLPVDWRSDETSTQARGDAWHRAGAAPFLRVPSAIVPLVDSPDVNVLINNAAPESARIELMDAIPFSFDMRLFQPRIQTKSG